MNDIKEFSSLKLAIGAVAGAILLNLILRVLLKFEGVPITLLIAGIVSGSAFLWVVKVVQRAPTKSEHSRFMLFYSGILAALCLGAILLAYVNSSLNAGGLVILFLHYLPYPFFVRLFFSQKNFDSAFKK